MSGVSSILKAGFRSSRSKRWVAAAILTALFGFSGWLCYSFRTFQCALSDGRVVVCKGPLKGKKVYDSEFDLVVYEYDGDQLYQDRRRLVDILNRFGGSGRRSTCKWKSYSEAPEILLGGVRNSNNGSRPLISELDGGYDYEGRSECWWSAADSYDFVGINDGPLPRNCPQWIFDFKDDKRKNLGRLSIPNQFFDAKPRFTGSSAPLDSRMSKGVLKLTSAFFEKGGKVKPDKGWREVRLKFDASGCPSLLPCQVLGILITDSWGNIRRATCEDNPVTGCFDISTRYWDSGDAGRSPDLHVKMGICRGRGAKFSASELVCFDHLALTGGTTMTTKKRFPSGRELTLGVCGGKASNPERWSEMHFDWELADKGPCLWPIVSKTVGYVTGGCSIDIDPFEEQRRSGCGEYWICRDQFRVRGATHEVYMVDYPVFKAGLSIPPEVYEYDLYVALEEPTVFEFFVRISDLIPPGASEGSPSR